MNESIIRRVGLTKQTGKTDKRGKRIFYILQGAEVMPACFLF